MPAIVLIGPNGIGKTSAVRRWCVRYSSLLVGCCCDSSITIRNGTETKERGWQGKEEERGALISKYKQEPKVVVLEAASGYGVRIAREMEPVAIIVVTSPPESAKRFLQQRCERSNKKFREDYWTLQRLSYEGSTRYLNFVGSLPTKTVRQDFEIRDQETDWVLVDEYFYKTFRKLHNQLVR